MGLIIIVIIGFVVGVVVYCVLNSWGGFFGSLVVGLVGVLVGGELVLLFNLNVIGGILDWLIIVVIGVILFLYLWKKVFK